MQKRWKLDKRGYFFLIDSILALSVLAVGAFLVFTFYAQQKSSTTVDVLSEDMMSLFADNKISGINNLEIGLGGTFWSSQAVIDCNGGPLTPDYESTALQQIAIFYNLKTSTGKECYVTKIANPFVEKLAKNNLPKQYNFEFWINDDALGSRQLIYPSAEQSASKSSANVLIPSKKIVYGLLSQDTGQVFGPYSAEVLVWK